MIGAHGLRPDGSFKRQSSKDLGTGQGVLPLGLLPVPNVSQGAKLEYRPPVFAFQKEDFDVDAPRYYSRQSAAYGIRKEKIVTLPTPDAAKRSGFAIHRFRSGELTGARFTTGLDSKVSLNPRSGALVTETLTQKARTKIRRAIQNAEHDFKCFLTVTFAPCKFNEWQPDFVGPVLPRTCKPWEHNPDGSVRHDFAKYKFKKFMHSIKVAYDRKAAKSGRESDRIAYVWVAEIQLKSTNNIHFHALVSQRMPIKWLTTLWGQANNSIDVRSINNLNHASCYIRKYMEKDKSPILGNRYAITQGLRQSMQPEKTVINGRELQRGVFGIVLEMMNTIEINGGKVLEHGFYIPTPCRSVMFRNKEGKTCKTMPVFRGLHLHLLQEIDELCTSYPF